MHPERTAEVQTTRRRARIEVAPLAQHIGAEIRGVDLASDLDDDTVAAIRDALLRWKVVFFRDQQLDRDRHVAFGARFGEVTPAHPTLPAPFPDRPEILVVKADPHSHDPKDSILEHRWHSDVTYVETPPLGSILRAIQVPPYGADTEWTNTTAAYATLSEPLRSMIDGLHAVHHNVLHMVRGEPTPLVRAFQATRLRALHPVVTVHPETGERNLFVNPDYTSHIAEMSRRESAHVLACLYEHLASREFTVRFHWEPGSVAFWDNRSTAHLAPADVPAGFHRAMERITLAGTKPVGVNGFVSYALDEPDATPQLDANR
ncbi:MAG: TauD/TfdA family dioxygenase [Acidimicrobiales bacterium]